MAITLNPAFAAPYDIIDLGKVEGGTNSFAYGINNTGETVGFGNGPLTTNSDGDQVREFGSHAIQFADAGLVDLGALVDGTNSFALSINDSGVIVGYSDETRTETDSDGNQTQVTENFATMFNSGVVTKIPGLTGLTQTRVFNINNNDFVVGTGRVDIDPDDSVVAVERGFVINTAGTGLEIMPSLTVDSVARQSHALSINDMGNIVGWSEADVDGVLVVRAFMTSVNAATTLEELPNLGTRVTIARDINNQGVIVGSARHSTNSSRTVAFVYDSTNDSELTRLPFFESRFDNAIANAINDSGQIVGQALVSVPTSGINTGFLYENNELKNLNNLIPCDSGWRIDNATNINNNGEIIGHGLRTEVVAGETINEVRAFKLMPTGGTIEICETPDEGNNSSGGSFSWLVLGLLGLFGLRRRKIA